MVKTASELSQSMAAASQMAEAQGCHEIARVTKEISEILARLKIQ